MFEIWPTDRNLKLIFTQKWASVDWGGGQINPLNPLPAIATPRLLWYLNSGAGAWRNNEHFVYLSLCTGIVAQRLSISFFSTTEIRLRWLSCRCQEISLQQKRQRQQSARASRTWVTDGCSTRHRSFRKQHFTALAGDNLTTRIATSSCGYNYDATKASTTIQLRRRRAISFYACALRFSRKWLRATVWQYTSDCRLLWDHLPGDRKISCCGRCLSVCPVAYLECAKGGGPDSGVQGQSPGRGSGGQSPPEVVNECLNFDVLKEKNW